MKTLSSSVIHEAAAEYERTEPFYVVESDRLETMPTAFAEGSFVWKDAEWVVRWFGRRALDGTVHPAEAAFRENDSESIRTAIDTAAHTDDVGVAVSSLTALVGVDVPIASAFLQYIDPESSLVCCEPMWNALQDHDELSRRYPDPVGIDEYERYLDTCRAIAEDRDVSLLSLSRALWQLAPDRTPSTGTDSQP